MGKNFGIEIKFSRPRQGVLCDAFQFFQDDKIVLNKKNNIIEISVEAAIQFAQRNAVRIGNIDFQIPKLTDADTAFVAVFRPPEQGGLDAGLARPVFAGWIGFLYCPCG